MIINYVKFGTNHYEVPALYLHAFEEDFTAATEIFEDGIHCIEKWQYVYGALVVFRTSVSFYFQCMEKSSMHLFRFHKSHKILDKLYYFWFGLNNIFVLYLFWIVQLISKVLRESCAFFLVGHKSFFFSTILSSCLRPSAMIFWEMLVCGLLNQH